MMEQTLVGGLFVLAGVAACVTAGFRLVERNDRVEYALLMGLSAFCIVYGLATIL